MKLMAFYTKALPSSFELVWFFWSCIYMLVLLLSWEKFLKTFIILIITRIQI